MAPITQSQQLWHNHNVIIMPWLPGEWWCDHNIPHRLWSLAKATQKKERKKEQKPKFSFLTLRRRALASSREKARIDSGRGWMQDCSQRLRAGAFGTNMTCSVSQQPNTLSLKLLSISAGKGSLAPKSTPVFALITWRFLFLEEEEDDDDDEDEDEDEDEDKPL